MTINAARHQVVPPPIQPRRHTSEFSLHQLLYLYGCLSVNEQKYNITQKSHWNTVYSAVVRPDLTTIYAIKRNTTEFY
ncbi:hypothetical protein J6590_092479 [Homalodisca vitripennis]|nr:hypothetical protein J6590_092479 [Homalodisca vitripennis]